ncbi:MAG: hypothetical protein KDI46_07655 [Alphaproteobacteria bacterium]|nr:hypothetical protein [Alphaproteobacteria bacterium]MCB1651909.1 hypothetical protein [Alphaproteobacteria bacterium]
MKIKSLEDLRRGRLLRNALDDARATIKDVDASVKAKIEAKEAGRAATAQGLPEHTADA